MTQLTFEKAQVLAKDYGFNVCSVRGTTIKGVDGIVISDLFFKTGTTVQHAKMVLDCIFNDDEVSRATLAYHRRF